MKTLWYFDKLCLNKNDSRETIHKKLKSLYEDSYSQTKLSFNGHYIFYDKEIIDLKVKELTDLQNLITFDDYHYNDSLTKEIHGTFSIENQSSSRKAIKNIINESNAKKDKGTQLEKNIIFAYQTIKKLMSNTIDENNLKTIYQILTTNIKMNEDKLEDGANYRLAEVNIGKNSGIDSSSVIAHMNKLFNYINDGNDKDFFVKALLVHLYFELIHPYYDFNGRAGRIMVYWYSLYTNKEKEFLFFSSAISHYRDTYLKLFNETQKMRNVDATYYLAGMFDILIKNKKHYLIMQKIKNEILNKHKKELSFLAKDFIMLALAKKDLSGSKEDIWIGKDAIDKNYPEYSTSDLYNELNKLAEWKVIDKTTTRPMKIRFLFEKY